MNCGQCSNPCSRHVSRPTVLVEDDHAYPTEPALMRFSMSYEPDVNGKPLTRRNCARIRRLMIGFKNGCKQGFFSSCGKQDRSNLKSFKGWIGAATRMIGQEPRPHGVEEKPAKVPPVVGKVRSNAVCERPGMRCRSPWRLKKRSARG